MYRDASSRRPGRVYDFWHHLGLVAVESPTYHGILQSLERRGLKALEIGVDSKTGVCLDDLNEALKKNKVAACVFMPGCHNPSGCGMPEANKIELGELLGKRNIPLIEDDALGELNYESGVLPAKAYDRFDNTLYCSSFSKTLAPGFRIGWVSAGKYHSEIEKLKYSSNIQPMVFCRMRSEDTWKAVSMINISERCDSLYSHR